MKNVHRLLITSVLTPLALLAAVAEAAPPTGWDRTIILRGQERVVVKSTPIEQRPNRPLHVYGNTVRRLDQRGRK